MLPLLQGQLQAALQALLLGRVVRYAVHYLAAAAHAVAVTVTAAAAVVVVTAGAAPEHLLLTGLLWLPQTSAVAAFS